MKAKPVRKPPEAEAVGRLYAAVAEHTAGLIDSTATWDAAKPGTAQVHVQAVLRSKVIEVNTIDAGGDQERFTFRFDFDGALLGCTYRKGPGEEVKLKQTDAIVAYRALLNPRYTAYRVEY